MAARGDYEDDDGVRWMIAECGVRIERQRRDRVNSFQVTIDKFGGVC